MKLIISTNTFAIASSILCSLSFINARNLRNKDNDSVGHDGIILTSNQTGTSGNFLENVPPTDVTIPIKNMAELSSLSFAEQPIIEKQINEPIYCPATRYEPWHAKTRIFRTGTLYFKLGYTAASWNYDPSAFYWNDLEELSWDSPAVANVYDELENLGYDEDKWDCCINHYEDFSLEELIYWNYTEQVRALYALGWTQENFGTTNETLMPDTENLLWQNLTAYQQYMAASKLCYTKETWDEELSLDDWPEGFAVPDSW